MWCYGGFERVQEHALLERSWAEHFPVVFWFTGFHQPQHWLQPVRSSLQPQLSLLHHVLQQPACAALPDAQVVES